MSVIHTNSVREELERIKAEFNRLNGSNKVSNEMALLFQSLVVLIELLFSIFLEKRTKKTSRNSGKPPSQTEPDNTAKNQRGTQGKGKTEHPLLADNTRTVTTDIVLPVTQCGDCGESLESVKVERHERRTRIDIVFEKTVEHFDAEIKQCPVCQATSKGEFPCGIHGKLQYGAGIKAFVIHLLVTQMVAVNRVQKMMTTLIGQCVSEATLLGYILKLHVALAPWEEAAKTKLLAMPCIHTDETSLKVERKNQWIHVYAAGDITLKCLHAKRGIKAMEDNDIIPRYGGVLVHDCWASYLSYDHCQHGLCGSHLLRELTFIIDAHQYRWARQLKALLQTTCHTLNQSKRKRLSEQKYLALQKRYRTILTQGQKELPELPNKPNGKKGKVAKSDAHNLWERFKKHEGAVLRFARDANVPFTNNRAERDLRMAKVKQKVSGCFRSQIYAQAYCRISSYLQSMANQGVNPIIAIQMALDGNFRE